MLDVMSRRVRPRWSPMSQLAVPVLSSERCSATGIKAGGAGGREGSESISMGDGFLLGGDTGRRGIGSNDSMPGSRTLLLCAAGSAIGRGPGTGLWN